LIESLAGAASQIGRGVWWSARLRLTTAIGLLAQFRLLPFRGGSITLRPRTGLRASRLRLRRCRLPTASAIAVTVAWRGAPFSTTSAALTLSSTASAAVTAALVTAAATPT